MGVFSSRYSQNYILNGKFNPKMNTIRAFLSKIRTLFPIFKKGREMPRVPNMQGLFQKEKTSGDRTLCQKVLFSKKLFFLKLNQKRQKQLPIRGDSTSTCPSGLSKCSFVRQRCPFIAVKSLFPTAILI